MTQLTEEDIQAIVSNNFGSKVKLVSYHLKPFSKNNCGIFGTHRSLVVDVKFELNKKNEVKSHIFFVKTEPDANIQNFIMDKSVFDEEVHFYKKIHTQLLENKCDKWSPKCYLAKNNVLVFEDLRNQGYHLYQETFLTEQYVKSALTTLARFHASSIIAEARLGKTFRMVYGSVFDEKIFSNFTKISRTTKFSFETLGLIAEKFGLDTNLVSKITNRIYQMATNNTSELSVICHGDLWKNNLMFDDADPPNCILIDYQLLRYHSPVLDIGMLLYLNTTSQFRKKSEISLLEHYYLVFRDLIERSECKIKIPTFDSIVKDYQEYRLIGISYGCMYLPGIFIKLDFEKMMNDSLLVKKWFLENRIDAIRSTMDKDPVYESKIKELVYEFMEEGKRVLGV